MENNTFPTLQAKKDKAIEVMKILDIYKPFIQSFKQSDKVRRFLGLPRTRNRKENERN